MRRHEDWLKICGSKKWADQMLSLNPQSKDEVLTNAEKVWNALSEADCLEAFSAHPKIGDKAALSTAHEQSGAKTASSKTLDELRELNEIYLQKFGFIYIVCATGKSGDEMLEILKKRLQNTRAVEIKNARAEQLKIIRLRLEKTL